jgi:hypothetical protein
MKIKKVQSGKKGNTNKDGKGNEIEFIVVFE